MQKGLAFAKLTLDYAETQKIVAEPFPQQAELKNKEERLATPTEELNQAAIEAKKNAPKRDKPVTLREQKCGKKQSVLLCRNLKHQKIRQKQEPGA